MSLTPKITIRPGTERQQNVGIMGNAIVEMQFNGATVVKLNNIQVKKSKAGNWYIQYPSEEDKNGKMENGYPVKYPFFLFYPGEAGKDMRQKLQNALITETQSTLGAGSNAMRPQSAPQNTQPMGQAAPVVQGQAPSGGADLEWTV